MQLLMTIPAADDRPRPDRIGKASVDYIQPRTLLNRATGFISGYDFTLNPYSGCTFACSYCYAAFFTRDESLTESWGQWVAVKENAVEQMRAMKPGRLDAKTIYMSTVTDPYQPIERQLDLTGELLDVLVQNHRPKLLVQTRGTLAVRDIPRFKAIEDAGGMVQVNTTITTDDDDVRRLFEPQCPNTNARLKTVTELTAAGVRTCVTMTPLLLTSDPNAWADRLLETGCERFIVQPFQNTHSAPLRMVGQTREGALRLMAGLLGCSPQEVWPLYRRRYDVALSVLKHRLPELGQGREGFAPPF